ncbi:MAG: prolipoprotein diacylglyceryl transferase [Actinomycetes bacterium]
MTVFSSIPSPPEGVWHLGPLPIRGYAFSIIAGIALAVWVGERRWRARGGDPGIVMDVALWAVPFGIIGGRLYHVITSPQAYFGEGGHPVDALKIWQGGLGIWGAVALGGVGAWIGCRRRGVPLPPFGDAVAPGIALAQAVGRWGNWFNQELFGGPTTLPWGLQIDVAHRPVGYEQYATFHPTFLYESLWLLVVAGLVVWADRRWLMGHGRAFALYVALYCVGRFGIELLRIDPANTILGLRVNTWISGLVFVGSVCYFVVSARKRPGREDPASLRSARLPGGAADSSGGSDDAGDSGDGASHEVSA